MSRVARVASVLALEVLGRMLPRLSPAARSGLAGRVLADRRHPRARTLAGFFDRALLAWRNRRYDISQNGEEELLRRLAPFRPRVVFDVGANEGEWTLAAFKHLAEARVHAFEIAPDTAARLAANLAAVGERAVVNRFGLAEAEGEVTIYVVPGDSTATSTLADAAAANTSVRDPAESRTARARASTGDSYMAATGVDRIDLLKIDVEGAEPGVLRGFGRALGERRIDVVQFEDGLGSVLSRFLLADFAAFFEARGYVIGKLLPDGVAFKPDEVTDEDFIGPNYVACLADRADLVAALRCEPLRPAV